MPFRPGLCHLDGRILPLAEARLDPRDRGFLFGDSLYEGLKVVDGSILFLEPHLARLRAGLERIRIPEPADLAGRCRELVAACELGTGFLYLQVSRGAGPRSRFPPTDRQPTVFLEATERVYDPPATRDMAVTTVPDARWRHCDLKTTSMLATALGKLAARDAGSDEVVFVSEGGEVREAGSANFFACRGEVLETHPLDGRVLAGVTRALVVGLARDAGLELRETPPRMAARGDWSEAFLTGTITGLQAVTTIDGEPVAGGSTGAWTRRLGAALGQLERREQAAARAPA